MTQRQFWIRPSVIINRIMLYCLAVAAKRYQIEIHVACFMSNHWHAVITDPHGNIPQFLAWFHKYTANCVNDLYGREENMWADSGPHYDVLNDEKEILAATIYCMANPVKAGLVETADLWPGICSLPQDVAGAVCDNIERPPVYFSPNGTTPARVSLVFTRLPIFDGLSDEKLIALVDEKLRARQAEIAAEMEKQGRSFKGAQVVLDTEPSSCPEPPAVKPEPELQVDRKHRSQAAIEAAKRRREFLQAYTDAREQFLAGNRNAVFPAGTYALVRRYGVAVESYAPS